MPAGVTSSIRSVTSSTLGFVSVGYQSSVSISRLQPSSSLGVTLLRSSGSWIAFLICRRPAARNGASIQRCRVIPTAPTSMKAKTAARSSRCENREALEEPLGPLLVGEVHLRHGPPRRALVDVDPLDDRLDRGHDLDRAAPCPDHRHPLAGEVDVVAPLRRVERRALEAVEPRDRRHGRDRQLAAGREQDVGLVLARARLQDPLAALAVPASRSAPPCSCGCGRGHRGGARRPRGRPGSRPGARSDATSAGSGRRRTRTGATGRRRRRRDRCCGARHRRRARRARTPSRRRSRPGAASRPRRRRRSRRRRRRSSACGGRYRPPRCELPNSRRLPYGTAASFYYTPHPPIGARGFAPQNSCEPIIPIRCTSTMFRIIDLAVA